MRDRASTVRKDLHPVSPSVDAVVSVVDVDFADGSAKVSSVSPALDWNSPWCCSCFSVPFFIASVGFNLHLPTFSR